MKKKVKKPDTKKVNHLRDEMKTLTKEMKEDRKNTKHLVSGKTRDDVTTFVDCDPYAKARLYYEGCDFSKRRSKRTKTLIEAKKADLTVIGSGEACFTIEKGDTRKDVSITIAGEFSVLGINPSGLSGAGKKTQE